MKLGATEAGMRAQPISTSVTLPGTSSGSSPGVSPELKGRYDAATSPGNVARLLPTSTRELKDQQEEVIANPLCLK